MTPVTLRVDPRGYFLYWTDQNKVINLVWSLWILSVQHYRWRLIYLLVIIESVSYTFKYCTSYYRIRSRIELDMLCKLARKETWSTCDTRTWDLSLKAEGCGSTAFLGFSYKAQNHKLSLQCHFLFNYVFQIGTENSNKMSVVLANTMYNNILTYMLRKRYRRSDVCVLLWPVLRRHSSGFCSFQLIWDQDWIRLCSRRSFVMVCSDIHPSLPTMQCSLTANRGPFKAPQKCCVLTWSVCFGPAGHCRLQF